ncbi:tail fiber assembly protein [Gilliamella sp. B3486]|uniref:tail fiber assembly protein n=1 Tax=unclassified Gilliamella TaxID=2685620 RepID=UPI00226AC743|nr:MULTISPECIES: tail fiber assembly protein [unclassified Gilliamella]MCX8596822.1 tail fiber assembly protein [Gilliamella sp. B3493]MCX8598550.1 tail fiber assembly protein [Gilliamella sp. B3486]MCX8704537.1 tail fiber assembly protein [Gilliamella sp. B3127]
MTYTNTEYAELAIKANAEGRALKNINGKLTIVDPEPIHLSDEQIILQNQSIKTALISETNEKIAVLQDIIDLDMQESNEEDQLKQWKKYRILLTRIDTSDINVVFPKSPKRA